MSLAIAPRRSTPRGEGALRVIPFFERRAGRGSGPAPREHPAHGDRDLGPTSRFGSGRESRRSRTRTGTSTSSTTSRPSSARTRSTRGSVASSRTSTARPKAARSTRGATRTTVVPTSTFAGQPLYLAGREPTATEIEERLQRCGGRTTCVSVRSWRTCAPGSGRPCSSTRTASGARCRGSSPAGSIV